MNINRLPGCSNDVWCMRLKGVDCSLNYTVTDVADGRKFKVGGYTLYADGLPVVLDGALTSRMLLIEAENRVGATVN